MLYTVLGGAIQSRAHTVRLGGIKRSSIPRSKPKPSLLSQGRRQDPELNICIYIRYYQKSIYAHTSILVWLINEVTNRHSENSHGFNNILLSYKNKKLIKIVIILRIIIITHPSQGYTP